MTAIKECWKVAQRSFGCSVVQQTVLPVFQPLLGNKQHLDTAPPFALVWTFNERLRRDAEAATVHLMAITVSRHETVCGVGTTRPSGIG